MATVEVSKSDDASPNTAGVTWSILRLMYLASRSFSAQSTVDAGHTRCPCLYGKHRPDSRCWQGPADSPRHAPQVGQAAKTSSSRLARSQAGLAGAVVAVDVAVVVKVDVAVAVPVVVGDAVGVDVSVTWAVVVGVMLAEVVADVAAVAVTVDVSVVVAVVSVEQRSNGHGHVLVPEGKYVQNPVALCQQGP